MQFGKLVGILIIGFSICMSCAKRSLVPFEQLEKTNYVFLKLNNGEKVRGTSVKVEPHQVTVLQNNGSQKVVPKAAIRSVLRKPPVYDDYDRGISEEEIHAVKKGKNRLIYTLGGGALSFGVSFFIGSAIQGSGTTLALTTGLGGSLGTLFFLSSGNVKDRHVAIEKIRKKRRSVELNKNDKNTQPSDDLQKQLEAEKKKEEELRKQREKILRELGKEKKKEK